MDQNLGIIGEPYNTMSWPLIVRQYADKERKITLLHTDEICPVISAADTKWYGMLQLSHTLVVCKRNRILHLFSNECVLLNEFKRSLAVYCSLTSYEFRSQQYYTHPFNELYIHHKPFHHEGVHPLMGGPAGNSTSSLTSTDARLHQISYTEHRTTCTGCGCGCCHLYYR